ncbi:MAG: hypothetical protein A3I92_00535 [Candidatus Yanofskybacteria bacterium RIFCSPLOWO2_02_FULL_43_10b]|uniref:SIS domain-containing protein n=1 Tax=Candidatus Yanofskybacteria bacterium RIFCSPLOWO2_02_FULL_43_10b TaxID=1802704 RepID=A0A1F8H3I9_9BACT|nr:MAG: hypothetical protein A3I92_00535 [Candidatus Yanofskybacteria bacterium RIFCSPLOWO2_02_FULL_43_10b]
MIEEDIRNFNKQFSWEPEIMQGSTLSQEKGRTLVLGMGGSHLGADLLNAYDPKLGLVVHSDYGLPERLDSRPRSDLFKDSRSDLVDFDDLVIASSYSGNTEEVLDGLRQALAEGLKVAVIASGGKLLEIAKEKSLPYIKLPAGLQPRMSAGYQVKALAKFLGLQNVLEELNQLSHGHLAEQGAHVGLNSSEFEERGKTLAEKLKNKIPIIYSSQANRALAYTWKVRFNETAKIPAFYNIFPELNHNEMTGYSDQGGGEQFLRKLGDKNFVHRSPEIFSLLMLADSEDHPKIQKRMEIFSKLFGEKGFQIEKIALTGEGRLYRLFSNLLLADWTSYYIAKQNGTDPEAIPLVEEFKMLIS